MNYTVTSNFTFLSDNQFDSSNIKYFKIQLLKIINSIIEYLALNDEQVLKILKTSHTSVSSIKHLTTKGVALERILLFLLRLNCDVEISINLLNARHILKINAGIIEIRKIRKELVCAIIHIVTNDTDVPAIKTDGLSLETLMHLLASLGCNIEIIIREGKKLADV